MKLTVDIKFIVISCILILITQMSKADFLDGSIWEKKSTKGEKQYIVLLGDEHSTGNKQQVEDLLNGIPSESVVLVEDHANCANSLSNIVKDMGYFVIDSTGPDTNLFNLTGKISQKNKTINVMNLEFRISAKLFNPKTRACLNTFCFTKDFLSKWLNIYHKERQETMHYNDGPILNATYQNFRQKMDHHISNVKDLKQKCELACDNKQSTFNYNKNPDYEMVFSITNELDIRILHQIHEHKDKKYIFVCAGQGHTRRIEPVLFSLGYRCVAEEQEYYSFGKRCGTINVKKLLSNLPNTNLPDNKSFNCSLEPQTKKDYTKMCAFPGLTGISAYYALKYRAPRNSWKPTTSYRPPFKIYLRMPKVLRNPNQIRSSARLLATAVRNMPIKSKVACLAIAGTGLALRYYNKLTTPAS